MEGHLDKWEEQNQRGSGNRNPENERESEYWTDRELDNRKTNLNEKGIQ